MLSFFYFSLSFALFVLVYYLLNRQINELKQAEINFQDLYNNAPCGYHSLDRNGNIIAINDTELSWLGYSRDEVVGKLKITDLLTPESRAIFWENFPRFLESGWVKDLEFQLIRKDGTILPALVNATVIRDAAGNFIATRTTLFDITQRKQTLEALRKSEERFRLAVDNIPDVFVIYDQQRRLQFVNAEGVRRSGLSEETLLGKTDEDLFPPEITQGYLPTLQRAVETRTSQTTECTITLASVGTHTIVVTYVPLLDERGEIYSILGITHDLTERKQTEAALAASEKRLRTIIEAEPECVKVLSVDGTVQEMNAAGLAMIEADNLQQVIGQPVGSLVVPKHQDLFRALIQQASQGNPGILEFEIVGLRGTHRWLESHAVPLHNEQNEIIGVLSITRDISDRKQAETALKENEARMRLALEAADMGTWETNLLTGTLKESERMGPMFGLPPGQANPDVDSWRSRVHPDDLERVLAQLEDAIAGRSEYDTQYRALWADGTMHWIAAKGKVLRDETGKPVHVVGVAMDITERKQAEAKLQQSEQKFRQLAENIHEVFWMSNVETSEILYVSPAYEQIWGRRCQSLYANPKSFLDAIHPDDKQQVLANVEQNGSRTFDIEYRIVQPGGSVRWVRDRSFPIQNESGKIYRRAGIAQDITSQKQAEAILRQVNQELEIRVAERTAQLQQTNKQLQQELFERQRVEQALRESEERWQLAIRGSNDGIWDLNVKTKEAFYSARWKEMLGYEEYEIGNHMDEWVKRVHPDDLERVMQAYQDHLGRKTPFYTHEHRLLCKNGTYKWILTRGQALWDEEGTPVRLTGSHTDISDAYRQAAQRKQAEEALRESEERFRSAFDYAAIGMALVALDGRWLKVNHSLCEIVGYSEQELKATTFQAITHPDDLDIDLGYARQLLNGEIRSYQMEKRYFHSAGHVVWILLSGSLVRDRESQPLYFIAQIQDITARKQAEEARRESEERLQAILDNATALIYLKDTEGRFILINRQLESLFNKPKEEILGKNDYDLFPKEMADTFHANDRRVIEAGEPLEFEEIAAHDDGVHTYISIKFPLKDHTGVPYAVCGISTDISDRKRAEEARRESEEQLQAILDNSPAVIYLVDAHNRHLLINHGYENLVSLTNEQIMGKSIYDVWPHEIAHAFAANNQKVFKGGIPVEVEEVVPQQDGLHTYITTKFPLRDANGIAYAVCGISTDITERKQVEDTLRKQACIFENLYNGVILTDLDGKIIDWNPAAERIFGYPKAEVLGKTPGILHKAEDSAVLTHKIIKGMLKAGRWSGEINFIRKDGTEGVCETVVVPLHNEQGQAIATIGVNSDLSDVYDELRLRKQAEEERDKLIAILEATPDIVATASIDEQIYYLNSAARKVLGLGENEDCANFSISKAHPEWAYNIVRNEGIPAAMRDGAWMGETAFLSHDGRSIPVSQLIIGHKSSDGSVKLLSTVARDITQQKKIAATLLEAERRWRSLLENVRLVVVGLDHNGKLEYANPCFLELVGYTKAEVLGKDWFETFLPQHQRHRVQNNFLELLEQEFYTHDQNIILTKSGEEKVIAWNNTLLQDLQGYVIGTLSIGEDITERQVIERMKDEFISVVSHELRTPLTSIHGALNLLSSGLVNTQSDKGRRVIEIAAESAERLVRLVNDILELERLESGKISLSKQTCNAAELIEKATDMMQVMGSRAGISLSVSSQAIQLNVDPDRIIQVLTNLIGNAIKFSARESTVWLSVELGTGDWGLGAVNSVSDRETIQAERENSCFPIAQAPSPQSPTPNRTVLFTVKDQGRGIPTNKIESIFERFHQVDASDSRKKGGTGLGLAICRSIVQQHGGQIWVESTLGEGSTFYFTLPVTEG